jgi:general secretion pathway protein I
LHYQINSYSQSYQAKGFTLIEVLIALVILSIALTAIIKATSQNIRDTIYLQKKTFALWAATEVMNEARLGLLKLPATPDKLSDKKIVLNQTYQYHTYLSPTPNPRIQQVTVDVEQGTPLIHLVSYIYVPA